jgi:cell division protein FtsB
MNLSAFNRHRVGLIVPVLNVAMGILLATVGVFLKSELAELRQLRADVVSLREFMAETRANRFTAQDGAAVYRELASLREEMAKIPRETPPKWFLERVDRLETTLGARITRLEEEVRRKEWAFSKGSG